MKVLRSILRRRLVLGLLASLALLAILLHGLVQSYLAAPAAQVLWWLRLRYLSIPQDSLWMIFILLAYLLFQASLIRPMRIPAWQWEETVLSPEQPFSKLVQLVENSHSPRARRSVCRMVSELAVTAFADHTGRSPHQLKAEILQHRLNLPEDVASYLSEGLRIRDSSEQASGWEIVSPERVDPRLIRTLEFLENEAWMEQIDGNR